MATKFTLYIDESGDSGIKTIRTKSQNGASPYMTLGACIIPKSNEARITERLNKITEDLKRKKLHCSEMRHHQKVYFARTIQKERFLTFGLISLKDTLRSYKNDISNNNKHYFNKCAQYLLERVAKFMKENSIQADDMNIVFESGNYDFSALIRLILACQRSPINAEVALLNHIDPYQIRKKEKHEAPLLQIADLCAHALYKCVDKNQKNFHIPEPRYLQELRTKFYHNKETGLILNYGIKPIHDLRSLKLDNDINHLLSKFSNKIKH